jgi:nicotinic acid mononucleotide adenylyltransferase
MISKNTKLYLITWLDSYNGFEKWEIIDEIHEPTKMVCYSVGWITKETKDRIMIIPHITDVEKRKTFF